MSVFTSCLESQGCIFEFTFFSACCLVTVPVPPPAPFFVIVASGSQFLYILKKCLNLFDDRHNFVSPLLFLSVCVNVCVCVCVCVCV